MKTRNIFAALAFGLFTTVGITTVGCTDQSTIPGKEIPGKEIHDTIKTTDTISKFNLSKITAEAAGDRLEVEFTPDAEWAFTSTAEWLVVVTERGTKTDRTLVFNVAENTDPVARVANTILSVGGVKYPLTINQKAAVPIIKVYGAITNFSDNNTMIEVSNIVSNLDIEVATVPEWVKKETAIVEKDEYGFWVVSAELMPMKYDTEVRKGEIVIKDKKSDVRATIAVVCDPSKTGFFLNSNDDFSVPFPGVSLVEGDMVRKITISQMPDEANLADPYVPVARNSTTKGEASDRPATYVIIDEVVPAGVSAHAAYATKEYTVSVNTYIAGSAQAAAIFIVRKSEVATFKVAEKVSSLFILQDGGKIIAPADPLPAIAEVNFNAPVDLTFNFSTLDLAGDPSVTFGGGTENKIDAYKDTKFKGTAEQVSKVSPSVTKGAGWSDYVYKISSTREQNDLIGLSTAKDLSALTYNVRVECENFKSPTFEKAVNVGSFKFTAASSAAYKLKTVGDKFNFSTWNAAGIEADNTVTILYRHWATKSTAAFAYNPTYNPAMSNLLTATIQSIESADNDNDGYVEVVVKLVTKAAVTPVPTNANLCVAYAPLSGSLGLSIPVSFVAAP